MLWKKVPAGTRQAWLDRLGRRLVWYFPAAQVMDILSDYREQFDEGHARCKTEPEIIQALGSPEEAAALLLEEEPAAKFACLRTSGLWGAASALCLGFLWVFLWAPPYWLASFLLLIAFGSTLFQLLRGPARIAVETILPAGKPPSPALIYYIPAALTAAVFMEQVAVRLVSMYLASQWQAGIDTDSLERLGSILRYGNALFMYGCGLLLALLGVWALYRSIRTSIRYFPGFLHAAGGGIAILAMLMYFTSTYIVDNVVLAMWLSLPLRSLPYFAGLVVARMFQKWVDGRRPLPRFFQSGPVTRRDWLHNLCVNLLGWFSTKQTIEILEDYQEQFELGREQGKSEADIIAEMDRPTTIIRDLLAEDRKARLLRRKTWPWMAMALLAGWLLLGMLWTFEFGSMGIWWLFYDNIVKVGMAVVALGTVSLFVLLRARERVMVERRFPAERSPSLWAFLLPLVIAVGMCAFLLYFCKVQGNVPISILATVLESSVLILFVLMLWALARCFSGSIWYLPAAIHAAGCACFVLCIFPIFWAMDLDIDPFDFSVFLPTMYPYAVGVVLAAGVLLLLRVKPRKEG